MSIADWKINKGTGTYPPVLYHRHDDEWKYWCSKSENRDWCCTSCGEEAPKEIQFAADLCKCNWDVFGSLREAIQKEGGISGLSKSTFPIVNK